MPKTAGQDSEPLRAPRATYARHERRSSQVAVVLAAAAFGAVLLLVVLRLADQYGPAEARARVLGFTATEDGVRITALVDRDPTRDAVCLFRSRDAGGAEVGHAEVRVTADPSGPAQVRIAASLPTSGVPVTGETGRCVVLPPGEEFPDDEPVVLPEGEATVDMPD